MTYAPSIYASLHLFKEEKISYRGFLEKIKLKAKIMPYSSSGSHSLNLNIGKVQKFFKKFF